MLPVLLACCALLGPASCRPSPAVPAVASTPPQSTAHAETDSARTTSAGMSDAGLSSAEPLTQLANTLASVQAGVTAMSERLDLLHDTLLLQQQTLTTVQQQLHVIEASQSALSGRVDTVLQQQRQQLDVIQAAISHIPQKVLGKACSSDTECSGMPPEAVCGSDDRCSCREGFRQVSDTVCRKPSRLTESCLEDADCQTLVSNTVCSLGECGCASGFWNHNNAECRKVSAVSKDGSCVGDQDCDQNRSHQCVSGACSCPVRAIGGYEYRLAGGPSCNEGNVELRRDGGAWGVVCDDFWGTPDANVVCQSLGFRSGSPTSGSRYGRSEYFYMDGVYCGGSETHLMNCRYLGWGRHDCDAGQVAGAQCT